MCAGLLVSIPSTGCSTLCFNSERDITELPSISDLTCTRRCSCSVGCMSISDDATARLVAGDLERTVGCSYILVQWLTTAYLRGLW